MRKISKHNSSCLFLYGYAYNNDLLGSDENVPPMLSLERDEELKERTRIKILTPNKLLTRLPVLSAQIKWA